MPNKKLSDGEYRAKLTCSRKKAFTSPIAAKAASLALNKQTGSNTSAYRCSHCGWFHVGHPQPGDRGTIRHIKATKGSGASRTERLKRRRLIQEKYNEEEE